MRNHVSPLYFPARFSSSSIADVGQQWSTSRLLPTSFVCPFHPALSALCPGRFFTLALDSDADTSVPAALFGKAMEFSGRKQRPQPRPR